MKILLVLILTLSSYVHAELPITFSDGSNEIISSSNIMRLFIKRKTTPAITQDQIDVLRKKYKDTPMYQNLKNASPTLASTTYSLNCVFDNYGLEKFAEFTTNNVGKTLSILVGGNLISAPTINEPILTGEAQINGDYTLEELTKYFPREHSKVYYDFSD